MLLTILTIHTYGTPTCPYAHMGHMPMYAICPMYICPYSSVCSYARMAICHLAKPLSLGDAEHDLFIFDDFCFSKPRCYCTYHTILTYLLMGNPPTSPARRVRVHFPLLVCSYAHIPYAHMPIWPYAMPYPICPYAHMTICHMTICHMPVWPYGHVYIIYSGGMVSSFLMTFDDFCLSKPRCYCTYYTILTYGKYIHIYIYTIDSAAATRDSRAMCPALYNSDCFSFSPGPAPAWSIWILMLWASAGHMIKLTIA